jgi:hypothetical protein
VPSIGRPAWAAALALVLVISLSLNVWWGILRVGPRPSADFTRAERLRTYQFQAGMVRAHEVGALLAAHPARWDPPTIVGFTPQAARTAFFHLGTLYADALAAVHGGAIEAAGQRLDVLTQALVHVQAPPALPQYLQAMQTWLQQRPYADEVLARFLALFEPLYEDAYATADTVERVILFRAGAWLENLGLAAAVGDRAALRQGGAAAEHVRGALTQLQAPPAVLEALERLRALVARQVLTDEDVQAIGALVQDIQGRLSD